MQRAVVSASNVASPISAEGIIATTPFCPVPGEASGLLESHLVVDAYINFTAGAGTTAVVIRVRRGTTVGGALVGQALTVPLAAGNSASIQQIVDDPTVQTTPPLVPGQQYVITVQQTGGTGAGSAVYVVATTTMS